MKTRSVVLLFVVLISLFLCTKVLLSPQPNQNLSLKNSIAITEDISESHLKSQSSKEKSIVSEIDQALESYRKLLRGEITVYYNDRLLNISQIISSEKDTARNYNARYALFDTNEDGLPELHIRSQSHYYVLTYKSGNLAVWTELTPYYEQLNNCAFLYTRPGGTPPHIKNIYSVMNFKGEETFRISFEKYDVNQNGVYDKADLYFFDDVEVSKEDWDTLTEKYLSIGSDQVEWFEYSVGEQASLSVKF